MEGFKKYLRELTVSPDYQSRGTFNPFYVLDIPEDDIRPSVGDGEIKYKNVDSGSGELIKNYGGKYHFQINVNVFQTSLCHGVQKYLISYPSSMPDILKMSGTGKNKTKS